MTTPPLVQWDLSELALSDTDPTLYSRIQNAIANATQFASRYKGNVAFLSAAELKDALLELNTLISPMMMVSQYANLRQTIDTQDPHITALVDRVETDDATLSNKLVFFELELGKVPILIQQKWLSDAVLQDHHYYLSMCFKMAATQLTELEEQWITLKDMTGSDAFGRMVTELVSSFEFEWEYQGTTHIMNGSQLRSYRHDPDPECRRRAMAMYLNRYDTHSLVLSSAFKSIIKDFNIERMKRGFPTPISTRLMGDDLDESLIAMIERITTESNHLVQRYYRLKQQLLGLPDMTLADLYAPLPHNDTHYTWQEAVDLVLESMASFHPDFEAMARRMIDRHRIDAQVLPTKQGGAFCSSSIPGLDPYVMTNFLGKSRDVSTLAHELGHAIHAMCCAHLPLNTYHSILPLCETASVFAEMLVTDRLLATADSITNKQAILCEKLEDIFATSHRQNLFSRFEQRVHQICSERYPSTRELCDLYVKELQIMFGDSVMIPDHYQWEWLSIPHMIDSPFYVFSYNVGNLLVMSLYQQYRQQGAAFYPAYRALLSAGSSMSPMDIGRLAGVDLSNPSFWQQGIQVIEDMVNELEATLQITHA